jgi:hypothetical protein
LKKRHNILLMKRKGAAALPDSWNLLKIWITHPAGSAAAALPETPFPAAGFFLAFLSGSC